MSKKLFLAFAAAVAIGAAAPASAQHHDGGHSYDSDRHHGGGRAEIHVDLGGGGYNGYGDYYAPQNYSGYYEAQRWDYPQQYYYDQRRHRARATHNYRSHRSERRHHRRHHRAHH